MLARVRSELLNRGLAAVIVTSADPHNSEYVAACFKRRAKLSGFHGSAGTAVVTEDKALLWTDGRYWVEAERTLEEGWELMKELRGDPRNVAPEDWLLKALGDDAKVGVDPATVTEKQWKTMCEKVRLVPTATNLVDAASGAAIQTPDDPIEVHGSQYSGAEPAAKIAAVREVLRQRGCDFCVVTALDEVAWLLNLRGRDVPCSPVFYSYAVVSLDAVFLFVDAVKVPDAARSALEEAGVSIHPYDSLHGFLTSQRGLGTRCTFDEFQVSHAVALGVKDSGAKLIQGPSIIQHLKAIKNETERRGFVDCHVRDGVALTRFLAWIDNEVRSGAVMTEHDAAEKLESFRRLMDRYVQCSFETIAGSGPNGADIHYHPTAEKSSVVSPDALLLVDSGGQYLDGTTDVTRTVVFREPKEREVEAYTRVLQGHIALNTAVFPRNTAGVRLDAFARAPLWSIGLDYSHGTGHGVGHFLNVHEGPHGIGTVAASHNATIQEHMIVSNEPGFYLVGEFGIRIENLDLVRAVSTKHNAAGYLTFESLTMAPLCRELIDIALLSEAEKSWVNSYHARVMSSVRPALDGSHPLDTLARAYLERHAAPL